MQRAQRIVVIGSGSSGGVAAARLSDNPKNEVLLVEAGPDYETDDDLPEYLRSPHVGQSSGPTDWGFSAYATEPWADRAPVPYARGKIVGGSSAVNAAAAQRGSAEDFDEWAALGNVDWSFEKVLPAFMRVERETDFPEAPYHGGDGPVPIKRYMPETWSPIAKAWLQVCLDQGYQQVADFNAPGSLGVGPIPRNILAEMRGSTARTYLRQARNRPNLTLRSNTLAKRVRFHGTRAIGVEVDSDGRTEQIDADLVVVSAGVIKSPQLLMLSGVGRRAELDALGIGVVVELEGVGHHLLDDPVVPIISLLKAVDPQDFEGTRGMLKYYSAGSTIPDLFNWPVIAPLEALGDDFASRDAAGALVMYTLLGKQHSEGWLRLKGADPREEPELHLNLLSDDAGSDIRRLAEATRVSYALLNAEPLRGKWSEIVGPIASVIDDDDKLHDWLRANVASGIHGVGTCKMGSPDDPHAVVGQDLAVHGTQGLFVADASIMPTNTGGMTNLPCFMIGERLAETLERDARE